MLAWDICVALIISILCPIQPPSLNSRDNYLCRLGVLVGVRYDNYHTMLHFYWVAYPASESE